MLDRLSNVVLALDGTGRVGTFADYAQWEAARDLAAPAPVIAARETPSRARSRRPRLGYLEQRELDGMEAAIHEAEAAVATCRKASEDPGIASNPTALRERFAELEQAQAAVDRLYARWAELEAKQAEPPAVS